MGPFADQESALAAAGEIEAAVGARCFIARRNR
ncbi:MAG: hypothetical protein ACLFPR_18320 [Desulfococcaceae bacterium]